MGIRKRKNRSRIQLSHPPIHGRIRGMSRFDGMNMVNQIAVGLFKAIKASLVSISAKPGSPQMRGNDKTILRCRKNYFGQLFNRQSRHWPPVAEQFYSQGAKFLADCLNDSKTRCKKKSVNPSAPTPLTVNTGNFRDKKESCSLQILFVSIDSLSYFNQIVF